LNLFKYSSVSWYSGLFQVVMWWHHNSEDHDMNFHCCENLNCHNDLCFSSVVQNGSTLYWKTMQHVDWNVFCGIFLKLHRLSLV